MKIVHFSDTHLGFSDLDVVNSDGINLREADFYKAFSDIIDDILQIKPDFVIHTGDLFHRTSPTNRAISFALSQINRLDRAGIKLILIAGNHEAPKTKSVEPILKIFDNFKNVYCAYLQEAQIFEFEDINFYALPHINDEKKIIQELEKLENAIDSSKKSILLMHCSVGAQYLMQEFGEWVFPKDKEYIFEKFDYVALGHWHKFMQVDNFENLYYSGSSERTSSADKAQNKGYIVLTLDDGLKVEFNPIIIRPFREFELDAKNLEQELQNLDLSEIKDALVEVKLKNLDINLSLEISNSDIYDIFKDAAYVKVKRELISANSQKIENVESITLESYFLQYLKENIEEKEEQEALMQKAKELFSMVEDLN